jgi:sugar phosphate isomerase/epimerase
MRWGRISAAAAMLFATACASAPSLQARAELTERGTFAQIPQDLRDRLGVQLYSYRHQTGADLPGVLTKIRGLGFRFVEVGPGQLSGEEMRAALDHADLHAAQTHVGLQMLRDNPQGAIDFTRAVGAEAMGVAWFKTSPPDQVLSEADVREAARVFNAACPLAHEAGLKLFYHVHGYEFVPYESGTMFDLLLSLVPAECMEIQLDTFWSQHGGQPPADMLTRYGGRVTTLHLKDVARDLPVPNTSGNAPDESSVALGTGQIDMDATLAAARRAGVRWYIIEDESPDVDEQMPASIEYLAHVKF